MGREGEKEGDEVAEMERVETVVVTVISRYEKEAATSPSSSPAK